MIDRATIGETYSRAIESSNLKLSDRRRGDVDLVIAAGLVPDGLAAALYRLQVEYDGVRAAHRTAEINMRNRENAARAQRDADRSDAMMGAAELSATVDHVLILSQLHSLHETKALFGRYAVREATKQRFMQPNRDVLVIAGRVLDVFLNPTCRHCDGRGFGGATHRGEPQTFCRPCRGSGHRRDSVGKSDAERKFAWHLLMATEAMMHVMQRDLRAGLNRVDEAKEIMQAAVSADK